MERMSAYPAVETMPLETALENPCVDYNNALMQLTNIGYVIPDWALSEANKTNLKMLFLIMKGKNL